MAFEINETFGNNQNSNLDDEGLVSATAVRIMQGVSDNALKDNEASFNLALPPLGSIHPRLGLAYTLKNKSVTKETAIVYKATLNYSTPKSNSDDPDQQIYPWNEPAIVSFSTINETGDTEIDAGGEAIQTVNGESFSVKKDFADQGIAISKAFLSYSPSSFYEFINSVNSDVFLTFPAGTLRVTGISATQAKFENQLYYNVTVNIAARRPINTTDAKAWYWRGPQKGTLIKLSASSSAKPVPAQEGGKRVTAPIFINENGTKRTGDEDIHFLEVKIYESRAFSRMNLF